MIKPKIPKTQWLADNFNLTPEMWMAIFNFQKGLCALCKCPLDKTINTDHDHKSGLVRGLLCFRCNQALRESMTLDFVRKVLDYLIYPPATTALGTPTYGFPGRVGTILRRKLIKAKRKQNEKVLTDPINHGDPIDPSK